jgi:hypothetical protein
MSNKNFASLDNEFVGYKTNKVMTETLFITTLWLIAVSETSYTLDETLQRR